jgi:hypothetical protein
VTRGQPQHRRSSAPPSADPGADARRHFSTVINADLCGPDRELLLQAKALSAGPVQAEPDLEQVSQWIICRPVRQDPGVAAKFIKYALRPEQSMIDIILGRRERPPPFAALPLEAVKRCCLLGSPGSVECKQDIKSQPARQPLDLIEITWPEERLLLASPQQRRLFHCRAKYLRGGLEDQADPHRARHDPSCHSPIHA